MSEFKLVKSKYGFSSVSPMPSEKELEEFYKDIYFQEGVQNYENQYTDSEYKYFVNESKVAEFLYKKYTLLLNENKSFLDIGCGEGYFSKYFFENNWKVKLLDYSSYGITNHNKKLTSSFIGGDIYDNLQNISNNEKFNLINIKNVLEHVIDPEYLINIIKNLMDENSLLRIQVPNDYSSFQDMLVKEGYSHNTWFKPPEHLHYFTSDSLILFLESLGLKIETVMTDFPIEIYLMNKFSNYVKDKSIGKDAHYARIHASNYIFEQGIDNYIDFFKSCAKVNFGRQAIVYCSIK